MEAEPNMVLPFYLDLTISASIEKINLKNKKLYTTSLMQLFVRLDLQIHNIYKLLQGFDLGTEDTILNRFKFVTFVDEIYSL